MGLLDDILGSQAGQGGLAALTQMLAKSQSGQTGGLNMTQVMESAIALVSNPNAGGLAGIVKSFTQAGLGQQVNSWVGTGPNQPVSAEQITKALGGAQLQAMAQQLGVGHETLSGVLTQVLPQLVNHLTPNGQVPAASELEQGISSLRQMLGR